MQTSAVETGNAALDSDVERLRELGIAVEILIAPPEIGVVARIALSEGYNTSHTDLLLKTTTVYPASAMDMFWVDPSLLLASGAVPQAGESMEVHFGRNWRRYSWHRNVEWVPGRDDLLSHFEFAMARLQRPV
jgi:hypothetical protein